MTRRVRHAKVLGAPYASGHGSCPGRATSRRSTGRSSSAHRNTAPRDEQTAQWRRSGQRRSPSAGRRLRLVYSHQPLARLPDDFPVTDSVAVTSSKSTQHAQQLGDPLTRRDKQKRRRHAAELVGNLVIDGGHLAIRPMAVTHRLADERSTIAVPFAKCSNPQHVAAEGHSCPIRHRCFGCASFSSDPSYLPEMRRRLLDLKAIRARVDAFRRGR